MVKIPIELPDWIEKHAINIFSGMELVAYKNLGGNWFVKSSRCNMCGKCCMDLKRGPFETINGQCIHLKKEPGNNDLWMCGLRINRPFGCCLSTPTIPGCTVKYEEVKPDG